MSEDGATGISRNVNRLLPSFVARLLISIRRSLMNTLIALGILGVLWGVVLGKGAPAGLAILAGGSLVVFGLIGWLGVYLLKSGWF